MERRIWIGILIATALIAALVLGLVAGGGIVFAATRLGEMWSDSRVFQAPEDVDPNAGVLVQSVDPGSAAGLAGLVRGDIILSLEGREVYSARDLLEALSGETPGEPVELVILHGDERKTLTFPLDERSGEALLGVVVCGPGGLDQGDFRDFLQGALLLDVVPGSPADQAGLEPGSRILAVDARDLDSDYDLAAAVAEKSPGDRIQLTVVDPEGDTEKVEVVLGENPDSADRAYLGVRYRSLPILDGGPLPPGLRPEDLPFRRLPEEPVDPEFDLPPGVDSLSGAVIREVVPGSPAEEAELSPGDIITAIDGDKVASPEDVVSRIGDHRPGDRVTLTILPHQDQGSEDVSVTLGEHPDLEGRAYLGVHIGGFFRFRQEQGPGGQEQEFDFFQRLEELLPSLDRALPESLFPLDRAPVGEA